MIPCYECDLCNTRRNQVVSDPEERDIMIINSHPDAKSDRIGIPMSGNSGKLLQTYLKAGNLHSGIVYLANAVMCHPIKRQPNNYEIYQCRKNIKALIDIVKPKIIIVLGRNPLVSLFNGDSPIYSKFKGKPFVINNIAYFYTYDMNHILKQNEYKSIADRHWKLIYEMYKLINPCHIC